MFEQQKEKNPPHANEIGSVSTAKDKGIALSEISITEIPENVKEFFAYRCRDCDAVFDEPSYRAIEDKLIGICPKCESEHIVEYSDRCIGCGKALYETDSAYEINGIDGAYCTDCVTEVIC